MAGPPPPPDGEAPLDAETTGRFLSSMGAEMVLVGGQALAFWMDRYGISSGDFVVSNDGDALGTAVQARALARALKAQLLEPRQGATTALVAQIRVPAPGGKVANIDILHLLYTVSGLRQSTDFTAAVIENSVRVEWRKGKFMRVMDPLDLLDSRVQNAAGLLLEKGPHVLTQARWAIAVAKAALLKLAATKDAADGRLGRKLQAVYTLAASRAGRKLLQEHGIDVLDAVDVKAIRRLAPVHEPQLRKAEAAQLKRQARSSEAPAKAPSKVPSRRGFEQVGR